MEAPARSRIWRVGLHSGVVVYLSMLGAGPDFLVTEYLVWLFLFLWYLLPLKTACFRSWSGLPKRRQMLLSGDGLLRRVLQACLCACHLILFFGLLLHHPFGLGQPF